MGSSKRYVTVTAAPENSRVRIWTAENGALFRTYFFSSSSTKPLDPVNILNVPTGSILTSAKKDNFGNRDCHHTYTEFSGDVSLGQVAGVTSKDIYNPGERPYRIWYLGGIQFCFQALIGKGAVNTSGSFWTTFVSTGERFYAEYTDKGRRSHSYSIEVISFTLGAQPWDKASCRYRTKLIFDQWKKDEGPLTNKDQIFEYTSNTAPNQLGIAQKCTLTSSQAEYLICKYSNNIVLEHFIPDDITDRIFENLTIPDVNNIENLKDLKEIKRSLPPIINLLKKRSFKSLAEFYLWYKYTYTTTKLDLKAYYDFFHNWMAERSSSSNIKRTNVTIVRSLPDKPISTTETTRFQIYSDNYNAGVLETLGLNLNLGNTWDLIPFSFVADWFINVGNVLANLDHYSVISKMNIHTVIISTKRVQDFQPLASYGCTSVCHVVNYQRDISSSLPLRQIEPSFVNPANHILDGTALVIAIKAKR